MTEQESRNPRSMTTTIVIGFVAAFHLLVFIAYYRWRLSSSTSILGSDLRAFYTSWDMVRHGDASRLYDLGEQIRTQSAIMGRPMTTDNLLAFVNPPFVSLGLSWLGIFDVRTAYAVFSAIQLVCLALACRLILRRELGSWSGRARVMFLASGVFSAATLSAITLGTFTPTMLLAIVGLAGEYRRSFTVAAAGEIRCWRAAGWLCVLTIKPQLAVFVVVALLAARQWRVLRSAAVIGAGVAAAATFVCGPGIWASYLGFLKTYGSSNGKFGGDSHYMWNVRGMLTRLTGVSTPTADRLANVLFLLSIVGFGLWMMRVWSRSPVAERPWRFEQTVALLLALTVLFVPHCNRQDMLLLLPGVVALCNVRRRARVGGAGVDWFVVVGGALSAVALTWDNDPNGYALHPLTLLAILTVGVAAATRVRLHTAPRYHLDARNEGRNEPDTMVRAGNLVGL